MAARRGSWSAARAPRPKRSRWSSASAASWCRWARPEPRRWRWYAAKPKSTSTRAGSTNGTVARPWRWPAPTGCTARGSMAASCATTSATPGSPTCSSAAPNGPNQCWRQSRGRRRTLEVDPGYAVAGGFVGFLIGLTGVGGGSLMAPILILVFGFSPAVAIGTDLWFAASTKTVGALVHHRLGSPNWKIAGRIAIGSVPAAIVTLLWLGFYRDGRLESNLLMNLLGAALLLTACLMLSRRRIVGPLCALRDRMGPRLRNHQFVATVAGGVIVGCLVTLTSVGAGALVAVMLALIYPLRLTGRSIVGTDI